MHAKGAREDAWLAGTWLKPAVLSLIFVSAGVGSIYKHRDLGSVLAALLCLTVTLHVWRLWLRARRSARPPGVPG